jgi:hypothetical protein
MRIDFINDGSHDSPIVRLYSDQRNEIEMLQSRLMKFGAGEIVEEIISNLPISESKIKLTFKTTALDSGITLSKDRKDISVSLTKETWLNLSHKLDPFLVNQTGFTWLYESKTNCLLFTTDGYWFL